MNTENEESILQEAQRITHGARNADYGHPLDDYTRTAALVTALLAHKLTQPIEPHEMALVMVCVKLSRQINAPKRDNMVDAAGYAWVAHACLEEHARRMAPRADEHEQETFHPLDSAPVPAMPAHASRCPIDCWCQVPTPSIPGWVYKTPARPTWTCVHETTHPWTTHVAMCNCVRPDISPRD